MHKKRILTSAPALTLAVVGCVAAAWSVEHQMRINNESLQAFALSSDDGREFEARLVTTLPEPLATGVNALVVATPVDGFQLATLDAHPPFQAASAEQRRAMLAYGGRVLSSRNRFDEALRLLETLSTDERSAFEASFAYAEALKGRGETTRALDAYQAHIIAHPNHQAGHINYAILLMRLDQHDAARPVLERAIEITSGRRRGKSYALLGIVHLALEDAAEAESAFAQSIAYRPGHAASWRRHAIAKARSGRFSQADVIATFENALALSPGNGLIEAALADYYFSVGRFDDALMHYRSASRTGQDQGEILLNRALNLLISERPAAARNVVRSLKSLDLTRSQDTQLDLLDDILSGSSSDVLRHLSAYRPSHALSERAVFLQVLGHLEVGDVQAAHRYAADLPAMTRFAQPAQFALARHLYREEQLDAARPRLQALVAHNDQSPIFWLYLARSESTPEAALIAHRTAHTLLPDSGRMTIEYAQALHAVGHTGAAIARLFAYLEEHPNEVRALKALAGLFDADGQLDRAEQIYRVIYDLNTADIETGQTLAELQVRAGDLGAALSTLDSLVELQPAQVTIREIRADVLMRLNRPDEARQEYRRILRLDPENPTAAAAFEAFAG